MNIQKVEITSSGIKKVLKKYSPERAIAEYIWNGFDAKATVIELDFEIKSKELDTYNTIRVRDNGEGIIFEDLKERFSKFYESNKTTLNSSNNLTRGKNGYGRFTFHKFAKFAEWNTTYKKNEESYNYSINIDSENLRDYNTNTPIIKETETGTIVEFKEIDTEISTTFINKILIPYLKAEFAWYLELREEHKLIINGEELDYSSIIQTVDNFVIEKENIDFKCKYIQWTKKMNDEYSKFYFVNNDFELKNIKTTSLNKKGDNFWHSLIVMSDFFDEINTEEEEDSTTLKLFDNKAKYIIFKELIDELNNYLKKKRKPFLKTQAKKLVKKYEEEEVFPRFKDNEWDKVRKESLEELVKEMYEVEPAIFTKLNKEQKRIFLELLNLVLDSSERENLFKIIDSVVDLDSEDRAEFAKILEVTRLKQVISTISLIKDRLVILEDLKKIVFNHDLKANERDHLQKFIEKHYWIFGEEYRMVCAEEVKFEQALQRYIYILRGVTEKEYINHPDKYKEMDLFLAGVDFRDGKPHNLVIEIKNPTTIKKLKNKQVGQIKEYIDVILKQDEFNDNSEFWSFYLIGQDYDDIIKDDIQNAEVGLLRKKDNHCLYVRKWSEVVNDVERRLKYLLEKLAIERKKLSQKETLEEIINAKYN